MILAVSFEVIATSGVGVGTLAVGVAAFKANERSKKIAAAQEGAVRTADLDRAEVEGWTKLIATMTAKFEEASGEAVEARREAAELRGRLESGNTRVEAINVALREAHERIAVLEDRITVCRAEITRLGGDVDEINRVGKRGAKGPPGDQGPPGIAA